jgi:hypothetical protein
MTPKIEFYGMVNLGNPLLDQGDFIIFRDYATVFKGTINI